MKVNARRSRGRELSMRRLLRVMATAGLGIVTGCYRYAPVQVADLKPGMAVRMQLSAVAVDHLRRGPAVEAQLLHGFSVTGKVSRIESDSLSLTVPFTVIEANVRARTLSQDISLARSDVQQADLRQLNRKRTMYVGLATAIAAAAVLKLTFGGESKGSIPIVPAPPDNRLPFFIRWRIP